MTQETPVVRHTFPKYLFDTHDQFIVWDDNDLLILTCLACGGGLPFSPAVAPAAVQEAIDAHLRLHEAAP